MKDTTELTRPKPTVNDIARVAGVSLATVDRVLNARPGVRDVTIEKVNKAIAELGFVRDTAAANLARRRQYRLMFILPETDNEFVIALDAEITAQSERLLHQRTRLKRRTIPLFPLMRKDGFLTNLFLSLLLMLLGMQTLMCRLR